MKHFGRIRRLALIIGACSFTGSITEAADFKDFLIMNACTVDGVIDTSKIPGRDVCSSQRNFQLGENIHYHLRDFGNTSGQNCKAQISGREISNITVSLNGKLRVLSYKDVGFDPNELPSCNLGASPPSFRNRTSAIEDKDSASVRWVDSAMSGIGFIMASGDGNDFSYWVSSTCSESNMHDSRRFYDGWPLAARMVPAKGTFGWITQLTQDYTAAELSPFASLLEGCPQEYHKGYTMWTLDSFRFNSGTSLDAVISSHYAHPIPLSTPDVANPGESLTLERLYFTDEWGFSRWEKWRREDAEGASAAQRQITKDAAAQLFSSGRCNVPYDMPRNPTPQMTTGTLIVSGKYAEKVINGSSNSLPGEYWYLVDCRDYSKLVEDSSHFMPSIFDLSADYQAFWQ